VVLLGTASLAACSGAGTTTSSRSAPSVTSTAAASGAASTAASGAASGSQEGAVGGDYLALGDSVPFGYDPAAAVGAAASRYTGYPELAAPQLGLRLSNLSCPGESSGSLIDVKAPDKGCARFRYAASLPGPTGGCDSHPSRAGAERLAAALVADVRSRPSPVATPS